MQDHKISARISQDRHIAAGLQRAARDQHNIRPRRQRQSRAALARFQTGRADRYSRGPRANIQQPQRHRRRQRARNHQSIKRAIKGTKVDYHIAGRAGNRATCWQGDTIAAATRLNGSLGLGQNAAVKGDDIGAIAGGNQEGIPCRRLFLQSQPQISCPSRDQADVLRGSHGVVQGDNRSAGRKGAKIDQHRAFDSL